MVNYSQWHTERSSNKKVHAIEEINVLSGNMSGPNFRDINFPEKWPLCSPAPGLLLADEAPT